MLFQYISNHKMSAIDCVQQMDVISVSFEFQRKGNKGLILYF